MKRKAVIEISSGVFQAVHSIEALSHSIGNHRCHKIFRFADGLVTGVRAQCRMKRHDMDVFIGVSTPVLSQADAAQGVRVNNQVTSAASKKKKAGLYIAKSA